MFYYDKFEYLRSFIECESVNEQFDYSLTDGSLEEQYLIEIKKFNSLYKRYFINSPILLSEKDLIHIIRLFSYYRKHNNNNCFLIAEFLLSYFSSINSKEYMLRVSNYKDAREIFRKVVLKNSTEKNMLNILKSLSFELYSKIIDYNITKKKYYLGDVFKRSCINFRNDMEFLTKLIDKYLKNNVYPSEVIMFDKNIKDNFKYYEQYLLSYTEYGDNCIFPENMINKLDKNGLLNSKILKAILNKVIERINIIQEIILDDKENFIRLIAEIEYMKNFLNFCLNKLTMLTLKCKDKIRECLKNLLYLKRCILSDEDRIISQMQKFKYEYVISSDKIQQFVDAVNKNIGVLYVSSVGDFEKKMAESLEAYAKYPINYNVNSYTIDSSAQTYLKAEDGFVESVFMKYYDEIGKKYTIQQKKLQNILIKGYYIQMIKYLKYKFLTNQYFIISLFNTKNSEENLIDKLISKGEYNLNNKYVILALNVQQIENTLIELLVQNNKSFNKRGFNNLNELAKIYYEDQYIMNGLMYINYIMYEKHGLNIRNNVSHGNYFNRNIDVEILTTFCSIMFLNGLVKKGYENYDKNKK